VARAEFLPGAGMLSWPNIPTFQGMGPDSPLFKLPMPQSRSPLAAALAAALVAVGALSPSAPAQFVELEPFLGAADGLVTPVAMEAPPGETNRLFIAEVHTGRVKVVVNGQVLPQPFLNISSELSIGGERGLFDLAFHPAFASNRKVYISYTNNVGASIVAEYRASTSNPNVADVSTKRVIFGPLTQPSDSHNGGCIEFGPDGMLYVSLGDGGFSFQGDMPNNAQRLDSLLGKILRLDVDKPAPHVPSNNPFLSTPGAQPLIWHYGLRNPWRFSFDREIGDLWISDVGQFTREEINFQPVNHPGGLNFGWRCMEGSLCTGYSPCPCPLTTATLPFHEYGHGSPDFSQFIGCSITGGYVYRGSDMPLLAGRYFFADFCTNKLWSVRRLPNGSKDLIEHSADIASAGLGNTTSFAQDGRGELYILDTFQNRILRIDQRAQGVPGAAVPYGCGVNAPGTLSVNGGSPDLGKKVFLALGAPPGGFTPGSPTAFMIAGSPDSGFPCGTLLPTFGSLPTLPGELLLDIGASLLAITPGSAWQNSTSPPIFTLSIPLEPSLYLVPVFTQAFTYDIGKSNPVLSQGLMLILGS